MHPRPPITGPIARYSAAILLSAGIHWLLFQRQWSLPAPDIRAQIELQQGVHAVELTLMPSIASRAAKLEPVTPPSPKPQPKPEPIKELLTKPESKSLEGEAPAEPPREQIPEKETYYQPPEKHSVDSAEQAGSLEDKGVNAKAASTIKPVYPRRSRMRGEEGTVLFELHISATGRLLKTVMLKSSGFSRLDKAGLKAVQQATYTPAIHKGKPTEDIITQKVSFSLK